MENNDKLFYMRFGMKSEYLERLIQFGELYMNCARYYSFEREYHNNTEMGDYEGFSLGIIQKNSGNAMYCFYTVFKEDIISFAEEKYIKIQKKMIDSFCKENTFFAIIKAAEFDELLRNSNISDGNFRFGYVKYQNKNLYSQTRDLTDESGDILFRKSPNYSYQKESRICLKDKIGEHFCVKRNSKNGEPELYADRKIYTGKTYTIGSLKEMAIILSVKDMIYWKGYYYVPYSKINIDGGKNDS